MRTAMASREHTWRQRWTLGTRQVVLEALIFPVIGPFLAPDPAHFPTVTGSVPTDCHARGASFTGSKKGDFGPEAIPITVVDWLQMINRARHAHAGDLGKSSTCDTYIIGVGVGRIKLRRQAD